MSKPSRAVVLCALLLAVGAFAGMWIDGTPTEIRKPVRVSSRSATAARPPSISQVRSPVRGRARSTAQSTPRISGPIAAIRAIDLHGGITDVPVWPGQDLADPLPVPEGLFAELEVDLAGPVVLDLPLSDGGRNILTVDLDMLTVVIDDPDAAEEAGAVEIELTGVGSANELAAGVVGVVEWGVNSGRPNVEPEFRSAHRS